MLCVECVGYLVLVCAFNVERFDQHGIRLCQCANSVVVYMIVKCLTKSVRGGCVNYDVTPYIIAHF